MYYRVYVVYVTFLEAFVLSQFIISIYNRYFPYVETCEECKKRKSGELKRGALCTVDHEKVRNTIVNICHIFVLIISFVCITFLKD